MAERVVAIDHKYRDFENDGYHGHGTERPVILRPDSIITGWCMPCNYGEHIDCYDIRHGRRFQDSRSIPEDKRYCWCKHKRNHVEPDPIAGTCRVRTRGGDAWAEGGPCGKPAKGTVPVSRTWQRTDGFNRGTIDVPACGTHIGAQKRRDANDAKRVAEAEARKAERNEDERAKQVAQDQAALLRGKGFRADIARIKGGYEPYLNGEVLLALVERYELACRELGVPFAEEIEEITKGGRS